MQTRVCDGRENVAVVRMEEELLSFINLILSSPLGRTSTSSYITVTWTINTLVGSDTVIHLTTMGVDYNLLYVIPNLRLFIHQTHAFIVFE